MLSQPKSTVHQQATKLFQQHWRHLKGNYDLNSAFENADRLLEQKRTSNQFNYIVPLVRQFLSQHVFFSSLKSGQLFYIWYAGVATCHLEMWECIVPRNDS
jgi:hypothetical protein